jgi:hypothetical protein
MKELDFSPATNQLNELMFDVELMPIVTIPFTSGGQSSPKSLKITEYFSVLNMKQPECLSVVSKGYKLIHNSEALKIGKEVFGQLFPSVNPRDFIPYKVIASKRKTFCHIDLVHKDVNFKVFDQETWFPIIRITNSYNKTYALSFEIGFVRKLCSNGVIFDKKTVTVKINHTYQKQQWKIDTDIKKLKELEMEFISHMLNLKRFFLPKKYIFPLLCKALNLNYEPKKKETSKLALFENEVVSNTLDEGRQILMLSNKLAKTYADEFGENAYAAFNVITDILSHQEEYNSLQNYATRAKGLNSKLAEWLQNFTEEAEKRNFDIEKYLEKELKFPLYKETA